jgi:hypothetical protein
MLASRGTQLSWFMYTFASLNLCCWWRWRSQDSSVGIVTRLLVGRPRGRSCIPSKGKTDAHLYSLQTEIHPSYPIGLAVERPGREADHSLPFRAEIKNGWAEPFLRSRQLSSYSGASQLLMEPEGYVPCTQEPSTGPCLTSDQSSLYHPKFHFNIIDPPTSWFC